MTSNGLTGSNVTPAQKRQAHDQEHDRDSFGTLFLIGAAFAVVTLLAVAFVREVPLRDTVELRPEPPTEAERHLPAERPDRP